jgi:hypothetical protein
VWVGGRADAASRRDRRCAIEALESLAERVPAQLER